MTAQPDHGSDAVAAAGVDRAVRAARALYDAPSADVQHEPIGPAECVAAVQALAGCFSGAGGTVSDMLVNARAGAQVLSGDRLQGLSEIVQNADDAGATRVEFIHGGDVLIAVHNGKPLTLRNVHALAAPWLTTKRSNASATGRFGIGLLTLHSLADVFDLHSGAYHLRLGDPTLDAIPAPPAHPSYTATDTVLRVPLHEGALTETDLLSWADGWDESALLFLRSVRRVTFTTTSEQRRLWLKTSPLSDSTAVCGGLTVPVKRHTATAPDGRRWLVHEAEVSSPPGLRRAHKDTRETTPLSVALPLHGEPQPGSLFAGLPVVRTRLLLHANAQFDPIASRQNVADSDWNAALVPLLADLWLSALLGLFRSTPRAAWRLLPPADMAPSGPGIEHGVVAALETLIATQAATDVAPQVRLVLDGPEAVAVAGLAELAVEASALTGLLTPQEIAELGQLPQALPLSARDDDGCWRQVLDRWRTEHELPAEVSVADALPLCEDERREVHNTMRLVAAGIAGDHHPVLTRLRCFVLHDGTRAQAPSGASLHVFVLTDGGLASTLGLAQRLHAAYDDQDEAAESIRTWLHSRDALSDATALPVLRRLANGGTRGQSLDDALGDTQVQALREALELLGQADWEQLGPGIGKAIRLQAVRYDERGRPQQTIAAPAEAYQPKTIDREPDSFAVAADNAPGLLWIAPRYATVLRSPHGRGGLGAQRFLRLLGTETAPRLMRHDRLVTRYQDPRLGLSASLGGATTPRGEALRDLQASYSLDDMDSPDLERVLRHISSDRKAQRRRGRALALLAVLGRAWTTLGEHAQVAAARDYSGWQIKGEVRAWWMWTAGTVPWLDDATATPSPPVSLRLRTPATVAVHGPASTSFVHPAFAGARRDVLAALGVAGEPETRELLDRLGQLRDAPTVATTSAEAAIAYQALAQRLTGRRQGTGHIAAPKLRQVFSEGTGLILTSAGWRGPADVLRGEPVFAGLRAFVPSVPGTDALWAALQVRTPDLTDCLDVMRDLSRGRDNDTETISLDVLRLMVNLLQSPPADERLLPRLRRMPLLTSQGWTTARPVYCVDDLPLAVGIGGRLPIWRPGGEIAQFRHLLKYLRITELTADDTPLVAVHDGYVDDEATALLRASAQLLREDLARNDAETERRAAALWPLLDELEIKISDTLEVSLQAITGHDDRVAVTARFDREAGTLYLTDPEDLARPVSGGRAIAGQFAADQRLISQAWLAAVTAAREGRHSIRLRLAAERAAATEHETQQAMTARLEQIQTEVGAKPTGRPPATKPAQQPPKDSSRRKGAPAPDGKPASQPEKPARVLVDLDDLVLVDPRGELTTAKKPKATRAKARTDQEPKDLPAPRSGGATPTARSSRRDYTDLEKETLGLDLVRWVLASDDRRIVDLRAQHLVGADAVDDLRRYYELKVYAGSEPDEIVLEDAEIRRALSTPEFFLVVVSGLEGRQATPQVRVIVNPLGQLRMSERSQIRFNGVRQSQGLLFKLQPGDGTAGINQKR